MGACSTDGRGRRELASGRPGIATGREDELMCKVKGCRRLSFLGGVCGRHALELAQPRARSSAAHSSTVRVSPRRRPSTPARSSAAAS